MSRCFHFVEFGDASSSKTVTVNLAHVREIREQEDGNGCIVIFGNGEAMQVTDEYSNLQARITVMEHKEK